MVRALRSKLAFACGFALTSWCAGTLAATPAPVEPNFELSSTTFEDGGMLPVRAAFKANDPQFPGCFGQNVSPQLSWAHPRPGVKSYVITMHEIEGGPTHTDLVVYGIPSNVTSFAEGELSNPSPKFVGGKAYRSNGTWHGMCPPENVGTSTHHFQFRIRGTDLDPKDLPPGLTAEELDTRLKDHTKGQAFLVARFKRPR